MYAPGQYNNPEVSPIRTKDSKGLPPAVIINAEFDPLGDDGVLYASKLREAGVKVWEKWFPGEIHCLVGLRLGDKELIEYEDFIKEALVANFSRGQNLLN